MSGLISGLKLFFTKERTIILVLFILGAVVLNFYSTGKMTVMDQMSVGEAVGEGVLPTTSPEGRDRKEGPQVASTAPGFSSQQVANPSELLPSDANSQWASLNPVNQSNPQMPDMLQAGYHIGLDTIGQTMKNANLQLRPDPVIEKKDTGPWNQSTIEAN
jgi:hypothetical protein